MSLKIKLQENLKAADSLIQSSFFNSSIHHLYYACYQRMIYANMNYSLVTTQINRLSNSHEKLIDAFYDDIFSNDTYHAYNFNKYIYILKDKRHKADYNTSMFNHKEATDMKMYADEVIKILNEHYP